MSVQRWWVIALVLGSLWVPRTTFALEVEADVAVVEATTDVTAAAVAALVDDLTCDNCEEREEVPCSFITSGLDDFEPGLVQACLQYPSGSFTVHRFHHSGGQCQTHYDPQYCRACGGTSECHYDEWWEGPCHMECGVLFGLAEDLYDALERADAAAVFAMVTLHPEFAFRADGESLGIDIFGGCAGSLTQERFAGLVTAPGAPPAFRVEPTLASAIMERMAEG